MSAVKKPQSPSSSNSTKQADPWIAMERDVDALVNDLTDRKKRYAALAVAKGPRSYADAQSMYDGLQSSLEQVEWDIEDMNAAVAASLDHPEKFPLPTAELVRRQDFLQQIERRANKLKEDIDKIETERRRRAPTKPDGKGGTVFDENAVRQTDDNTKMEMMTQERLKEDQEAAMERLGMGVKNLKHKAVIINDEMVEQDKMMADIEKDMSLLQLKIEGAAKKVGKMIDESSDNKKMICIIVLVLILLIMIFLLLSD